MLFLEFAHPVLDSSHWVEKTFRSLFSAFWSFLIPTLRNYIYYSKPGYKTPPTPKKLCFTWIDGFKTQRCVYDPFSIPTKLNHRHRVSLAPIPSLKHTHPERNGAFHSHTFHFIFYLAFTCTRAQPRRRIFSSRRIYRASSRSINT